MHATLENFLDAADGAGRLMAHARVLLRLSTLYQSIAPAQLGRFSRLVNYKSGTVVIHASGSAVAAKLRQLAPTLREEFRRQGVECTGLEVKVQAAEKATPSSACAQTAAKPLGPGARRELKALHDALPETPLRTALETLLARSA